VRNAARAVIAQKVRAKHLWGTGCMMKRYCSIAVCTAALLLVLADRTYATPEECQKAIVKYNSAQGDVAGALQKYAACVSDSQGHDKCSTEFASLRSTQDAFETVVSQYQKECP
jgi:hypothetical protein